MTADNTALASFFILLPPYCILNNIVSFCNNIVKPLPICNIQKMSNNLTFCRLFIKLYKEINKKLAEKSEK
jgi:hypothetical protein